MADFFTGYGLQVAPEILEKSPGASPNREGDMVAFPKAEMAKLIIGRPVAHPVNIRGPLGPTRLASGRPTRYFRHFRLLAGRGNGLLGEFCIQANEEPVLFQAIRATTPLKRIRKQTMNSGILLAALTLIIGVSYRRVDSDGGIRHSPGDNPR